MYNSDRGMFDAHVIVRIKSTKHYILLIAYAEQQKTKTIMNIFFR